ncbi:MAG: TlpA disulfide reductase family protein [Wenzhouxiangellaceae bacterium]
MTSRTALVLALAVVVGIAAGVAIAWLTRPEPLTAVNGGPDETYTGIGDRRPDFTHAGVNGQLWRAEDFDGRPTLVNFWATWCKPCLREMPLLQSLAEDHADRLNVVGIAVDDPGAVGDFVDRLGIDYPILIGTSDVRETQRRFGNPDGMLPYSVIVDAGGTIRWRHLGELDEPMLDDALEPLLERPAP